MKRKLFLYILLVSYVLECDSQCNAGYYSSSSATVPSVPKIDLDIEYNFENLVPGGLLVGPFELRCWSTGSPAAVYTGALPFIENWNSSSLNIASGSSCQWFSVSSHSYIGTVFNSYEQYLISILAEPSALVQNVGGGSFCLPCELGKYKALSGAGTCIQCPSGTFCDSLATSVPKNCSQGTYHLLTGAVSNLQCLKCPLAHYCSSRNALPVPCPAGTYATGESLPSPSSCNTCSVGMYSNLAASTACQLCQTGKFSFYSKQHAYQQTLPCTESPANSNSTIFELSGSINSKRIWCNVSGTITRSTCDTEREKYMTVAVQRAYLYNLDLVDFKNPYWWVRVYSCDYDDYTSRSAVSLTLSNYFLYCDLANVWDFTGGNSDNDDYNIIFAKRLFMHFSLMNLEAPNCLAEDSLNLFGYQSKFSIRYSVLTQSNDLPSTCQECPRGTFARSNGSSVCSLCDYGKYNVKTGQSSISACLDCPPGMFNDDNGSHVCVACEIGTYLSENICKPCSPGSYTNQNSSVSCLPCAAGTYADKAKATVCVACPTGTHASSQGFSLCIDCEAGKYNAGSSVACSQCGSGTYSIGPRPTVCLHCPEGSYSINTNTSVCIFCVPGTYSITKGSSTNTCKNCSVGSFNARFAATRCTLCPVATYAQSERATACTQCASGFTTKAVGSISSVNCTQIIINAVCTQCKQCPSNALYAKTTCKPNQKNEMDDTVCVCPRHHYYDSTLNICIRCRTCPVNATTFRFCEEDSRSDKVVCFCPRDYYGNPDIRCLKCPQCPQNQNTFPVPFCSSYIRNENDIQSCRCMSGFEGYGCCSAGKFCMLNSSTASDCPRGSYTNQPNMSACVQCPSDMFQSSTGATLCLHCPTSKTSTSNKGVFCS